MKMVRCRLIAVGLSKALEAINRLQSASAPVEYMIRISRSDLLVARQSLVCQADDEQRNEEGAHGPAFRMAKSHGYLPLREVNGAFPLRNVNR